MMLSNRRAMAGTVVVDDNGFKIPTSKRMAQVGANNKIRGWWVSPTGDLIDITNDGGLGDHMGFAYAVSHYSDFGLSEEEAQVLYSAYGFGMDDRQRYLPIEDLDFQPEYTEPETHEELVTLSEQSDVVADKIYLGGWIRLIKYSLGSVWVTIHESRGMSDVERIQSALIELYDQGYINGDSATVDMETYYDGHFQYILEDMPFKDFLTMNNGDRGMRLSNRRIALTREDILAKLPDVSPDVAAYVGGISDNALKGKLFNELKKNPAMALVDIQVLEGQVSTEKTGREFSEDEMYILNRYKDDPAFQRWVVKVLVEEFRGNPLDSSTAFENMTDLFAGLVQGLEFVHDWYNYEDIQIANYNFARAVEESEVWHDTMAGAGDGTMYEPTRQENIVYGPNWDNPDWQGWTIQLVNTENDLLCEGNQMNHCVGSYWNYVQRGYTRIFSLRDPSNKPHVTIEMDGDHNEVEQIMGNSNSEPDDQYKAMIKEWFLSWGNVEWKYMTVDKKLEHLAAEDVPGELLRGDKYGLAYAVDINADYVEDLYDQIIGRMSTEYFWEDSGQGQYAQDLANLAFDGDIKWLSELSGNDNPTSRQNFITYSCVMALERKIQENEKHLDGFLENNAEKDKDYYLENELPHVFDQEMLKVFNERYTEWEEAQEDAVVDDTKSATLHASKKLEEFDGNIIDLFAGKHGGVADMLSNRTAQTEVKIVPIDMVDFQSKDVFVGVLQSRGRVDSFKDIMLHGDNVDRHKLPWSRMFKKDDILAPLEGWFDADTGKYILSDGNHRLLAYKELGYKDVPVLVKGTMSDRQAQSSPFTHVWYAVTPQQKKQGFLHRDSINPGEAIVFANVKQGDGFHMHTVPFALDIAFLDDEYQILDITEMQPEDGTAIAPPRTAMAIETAPGLLRGATRVDLPFQTMTSHVGGETYNKSIGKRQAIFPIHLAYNIHKLEMYDGNIMAIDTDDYDIYEPPQFNGISDVIAYLSASSVTAQMADGATYYHGADGETIRKIAQDGYVFPNDDPGRGYLSPMKGRAYFTKDLGYALMYALGADMVGMDVSGIGSARFVGEGGLVVVEPSGEDILPDEDWIGEIVCEGYLGGLSDPQEEEIFKRLWQSLPDKIKNSLKKLQRDKLWEVATHARVGKSVNRWLLLYGGFLLQSILSLSPHYSVSGRMDVVSAWIFDKVNDNPKLAKDGSNFFEIAQQIPVSASTDNIVLSNRRAQAVDDITNQDKALEDYARKTHGDKFYDAITNTEGAQLTPNGVELDIARYQKPEQHGAVSPRDGVFYLPEKKSPYSHYYSTGKIGYGGGELVTGRTTLRNPIIVEAGTGGNGVKKAYDMIKGKGAYDQMRSVVLELAVTKSVWNKNYDLEGAVAKILQMYTPMGDDETHNYASMIVQHSTVGNTLAYAVQEHIVGQAVREAGYDGVLSYSKSGGRPRLSEVFDVRASDFPYPGQTDFSYEDFYADTGIQSQFANTGGDATQEDTVLSGRQAQQWNMATGRDQNDPFLGYYPESQVLIYMTPDEYINACASFQGGVDDFYEFRNNPVSQNKIERLKGIMNDDYPLDAASLDYDSRSGEIVSQEGGHRAIAAKELGIDMIPVLVYFLSGFKRLDISHRPDLIREFLSKFGGRPVDNIDDMPESQEDTTNQSVGLHGVITRDGMYHDGYTASDEEGDIVVDGKNFSAIGRVSSGIIDIIAKFVALHEEYDSADWITINHDEYAYDDLYQQYMAKVREEVKTAKIKKTENGYQVVSEEGKPLSKDNLSKDKAKKRLQQVEYFKHQAAVLDQRGMDIFAQQHRGHI